MSTKEYETGVIVARLQVHKLHKLHRELIEYVSKKHNKAILFLGVSPALGTRENPLDFISRRDMVAQEFPDLIIAPLGDNPSDEVWSDNLDTAIRNIFPIETVVLYGGRDSFAKSYKGKFDVADITSGVLSLDDVSGSELREGVAHQKPLSTEDFRAGVIYSTQRQYPRAFPTVDVAVTRLQAHSDGQYQVLMGKKPKSNQYVFIGGFVDPTDESLEVAASRELQEETGLTIAPSEFNYLASFQVKDWRYTKTDRIITTFFCHESKDYKLYPVAGDDIVAVEWVDIKEHVKLNFVAKHHQSLFDVLLKKYPENKKAGWSDNKI